ncbi:MAG: FAD-binding oxidoreductase [Acholeplasmataceae bacterium]|nr:FAD-binding oxidoreductase [Acholeplasmataceae bacterium]
MKADILIVGAGISGVAVAYNLAKKGVKNIYVIDKGYFANGATGRCGAGIRQQWGTEINCRLAKKSIEFFENAKKTLDYPGDLEFKQEGYLILAITNEEHEQFKKNVVLQNKLGIPSKQLTKDEALKIVPHLNPNSFLSATFCKTDGHLNPFKMTEAYYLAAKKLGVKFSFYEEVLKIHTKNNKIVEVITSKDTYQTQIVVNTAGGYAKEIGNLAGVDIPVYSENHEILATEPVEKMQGPMVMSFAKNIYCQQVPHGAFLMGRSNPYAEQNHDVESSWQFLDAMSKTVVDILPIVGNLRVVRQWGGSYNMSPDRQPIISDTDQLEGFYMACGFSGHGFMFAPMTGLLLTQMILNEKTDIEMSSLHLGRFKNIDTKLIEKSVV